jgi:RNA polymerase sigma factor (sigma-70 family)
MTDDAELLRRYAADRSEDAIAELVRRHLGLVYHAALRQCGGDHHRAEDVAQAVFTDLARKAGSLSKHQVLAGWLYTSTRFAATQAIRAEARRVVRERAAFAMNVTDNAGEAPIDPAQLQPVIDDALSSLNDRDREAVILRFFEGRTFADIGAAFSTSEDAARMRVDRALEKLRGFLARNGVTSTAAAVGAVLSTEAAAAVPAHVAANVTAAAIAGSVSGTALVATGIITMTKVQLGIALAVIAAGCGGLVWQQHVNRRLRAELTAQQMSATPAVTSLRASTAPPPRSDAAAAMATSAAPTPSATQPAIAGKTGAAVSLEPGLTAVDSLGNAGRATPRDAFATQLWAARTGDIDLEASVIALTPQGRAALQEIMPKLPATVTSHYDTPEKLMAFALAGSPHPVGGMEVLGQTADGPDDMTLQTKWQHVDDGIVHENDVHLHHDAGGWKMVVPTILVRRAAAYMTNEKE